MHLARVSRNNALYILRLVDRRRIELLLHACKAHVLPLSLTAQKKLVETVGIEPTVFLMSLIYSQLPSPLGTHLQIEFESSSAHVIGTIHLIIQGRQGLGTPLGILVTTSTYIAAGDSRPPLRYTVKLFEEAFRRDFLLLTLSKLATGRRLSLVV